MACNIFENLFSPKNQGKKVIFSQNVLIISSALVRHSFSLKHLKNTVSLDGLFATYNFILELMTRKTWTKIGVDEKIEFF